MKQEKQARKRLQNKLSFLGKLARFKSGEPKDRGVALLMVLISIAILSTVMVEILYTSQVQVRSTLNQGDAIKAYYLARTGVQMAMLELRVHETLQSSQVFKDLTKDNPGALDMIWKIGFLYPPPLGTEPGLAERTQLETLKKKTKMEGTITATIEDLSAKINLNMLAVEQTFKSTSQQLVHLIVHEKTRNEEFAKKFRFLDPEELASNIADFIDADKERKRGGDEDILYSGKSERQLPLNVPFVTISQLRQVEGVDEDLFRFLEKHCTVYGEAGINVNTGTAEVLQAISSELTAEDVKMIIQKREKEPFKDGDDFEKFAKKTLFKSEQFNKDPKVPITTSSSIYAILSTGEVRQARHQIFVVVDKAKQTAMGGLPILYWSAF